MQNETQTVELDEAATKAIAAEAAKSIDVSGIAKSLTESIRNELKDVLDPVNKKNVHSGDSDTDVAALSKLPAANRLKAQLKAMRDHDGATIAKLNQINLDEMVSKGIVEKASYLNEGTTSEGGAVIPPAEFSSQVVDALPDYGVLARVAHVWNTNSNSLQIPSETARVTVTDESEHSETTITKPTLAQTTIDLKKYIGLTNFSDELLQDSAVNLQAFLVQDFAAAFAEAEDKAGLTDSATGIGAQTGVKVISLGTTTMAGVAALTNVDFLSKAVFGVPTKSMVGGSFLLGRALVESMREIKSSNGEYILKPGPNGVATGTVWGFPYQIAEAFPTADAVSTVYGAFGNWGKYCQLLRKNGMKITLHDSGTVSDGTNTYNLISGDSYALRAVRRQNVGFTIPSAFAVLKTAAS